MFSIATELIENSMKIVGSNFDMNQLTFTPYFDTDYLCKQIEVMLQELEEEVELNNEEIDELASLISLFPPHDKKDEFEFRISSLIKLNEIANAVNHLDNRDTEQVKLLSATLSTCGHGPFRSLLEYKLNNIISSVNNTHQKSNDVLSNIICMTESVQELDEVLCELSFEDYINLGNEKRVLVAKELILLDRKHYSSEDFLDAIVQLAKEINFVPSTTPNYKYTVEFDELQVN